MTVAPRLAVLCAAAAVAAGCGGGEGDGGAGTAARTPTAKPLGTERAGSVVQLADCTDWRQGTRAERMATIAVIRGQLTPQRSKTAASPLPDARAYEVFDKACAHEGATRLRLYKLYARLQGFAPLSQ